MVPIPSDDDELDADAGAGVDRAQVGDELREVLDRVDVVVRRRADERDARLCAPQPRDERRDLDRRQLAALARLGALGDLDLELLRAREVGRGDAEAGRRDLLDRRVTSDVAAVVVPLGVLAALAAVGVHPEAPHADRQRLVRLGAERAERHRRPGEARQDRRHGLDLRRCGSGSGAVRMTSWSRTVAGVRASAARYSSSASACGPGRRERLHRLHGRRRVQVALTVAPEAREAGVVEAPARVGGVGGRCEAGELALAR